MTIGESSKEIISTVEKLNERCTKARRGTPSNEGVPEARRWKTGHFDETPKLTPFVFAFDHNGPLYYAAT